MKPAEFFESTVFEAQLKLKKYGYQTELFFFGGVTNFFSEHLNELAKEKNMNFIDMLEELQKHSEENLYFHWDGHLTPAGHRAVAEGLVAYFDHYLKP